MDELINDTDSNNTTTDSISQVDCEFDDLVKLNENMSNSYHELNGETTSLKSKYYSLLCNYKLLEKSFSQLKEEHINLQTSHISISTDHENIFNNYASLKLELSKAVVENVYLKDILNTLKKDCHLNDETLNLIDDAQHESMKKEMESLINSQLILKQENNVLGREQIALSGKFKQLLDQHNELIHKHDELNHNHDIICKKYDDFIGNYNDLSASLNDVSNQRSELNSAYNNLLSKYDALEKEHSVLGGVKNELIELSVKHQSVCVELDTLRLQYDALEKNHKSEIDDLSEKHQSVNSELVSQYDTLEKNHKSELDDLSEKHQSVNSELVSLREQINTVNTNYYASLNNQAELQNKYDELCAERDTYFAKYKSGLNIQAQLQNKYDELLTGDYKTVMDELYACRDENSALNTALQEKTYLNQQLGVEIDTLRAENSALNSVNNTLTELQTKYDSLTVIKTDLQDMFNGLTDEYQSNIIELTNLQAINAVLNNKYNKTCVEHQTVITEYASLQKKYDELVKHVDILASQKEDVNYMLQETVGKFDELNHIHQGILASYSSLLAEHQKRVELTTGVEHASVKSGSSSGSDIPKKSVSGKFSKLIFR